MKQEEILFFLGSTVVIVFAWIAFSVLHNSLTSTITASVNQAIAPIQPTFDTKTINAMTAKSVIVPLNFIQPQPTGEIIVTNNLPPQQPTPIASESASTASGGASFQ